MAISRSNALETSSSSSAGTSPSKADIGSNDEEFWFWVHNDERRIYWCNYDGSMPARLAVTYQPDWIIAALGLKPITPEEAAGIQTKAGDVPRYDSAVFPPTRSGGQTYTRMMIVWNQNRHIKQHRIYQGTVPSPRNLLAQADVSRFTEFDVGIRRRLTPKKCYLPEASNSSGSKISSP